jgi:shikimate dehydrogenase
MYPNCPATPLVPEKDLAQLKSLAGVLDVIYNPTRTGIVLAAEEAWAFPPRRAFPCW